MTRSEIEKLYIENGLTDYKFKTTEDLLKVHNINHEAVKGYNELDDLHKNIYEKFIINFFNKFGLGSRALLIPTGIYWVEHIEYLVKENDNYYGAGEIIYSIDKAGKKTVLHEWEDENYKHLEKIVQQPKTYLRFEYSHLGKDEWIHVIKNVEWY